MAAIHSQSLASIDSLDGDKADAAATAAALALKAPLESPVFTGDPQAPDPSAGDNDQSIATTAWVQAELSSGTVITAAVSYLRSFAARHG